jgi:hypothetical protein
MAEISQIKTQESKKKVLPALIIGGLLALGYLVFSLVGNPEFMSEMKNLEGLSSFKMPFQVGKDLTSNDSEANDDEQLTYSYVYEANITGETPFELLNRNDEVEFDQYDFGVFVTSINGQKSNDQFFWALYVNDEMAQVSSDQIELKTGDVIEWRWEEIESYQE